MKKIYPSKMQWAIVSPLRSITAYAKKHPPEAKVLAESGNRHPSLKHILGCGEVGITTERSANFPVTAKPVHILVPFRTEDGKAGLCFSPFIQFTQLEFRSLN